MEKGKELENKLNRLDASLKKFESILERQIAEVEGDYLTFLKDVEDQRETGEENLRVQLENLESDKERMAAEFSKKKYLLEKDAHQNKKELEELHHEIQKNQRFFEEEASRLTEMKAKNETTFERQKLALKEMAQDKKAQFIAARGRFLQKLAAAEKNLERVRSKHADEKKRFEAHRTEQINHLKSEVEAKREGWEKTLDQMKTSLDAVIREKEDTAKRLHSIQEETEANLRSIRQGMMTAREQLEIDKATFIEKAQLEEKELEEEIEKLQNKTIEAEKYLQDMVLQRDAKLKTEEEAFQREEDALKETAKQEAEKRDYEQKLLLQEKTQKEKELNRLKDDLERKKWYWDNQTRNMLMKKSVMDAEVEADRLRAEREARVQVKALEAKKNELKERLSEIQTRHKTLVAQEEKDKELRKQRWTWRKDRLWSLYEGRIETIRKEREGLQDQLTALIDAYNREKAKGAEREEGQNKRVSELEQMLIYGENRKDGAKKQRQIQFELEKTRLLAQIRECETLLSDWMDRLKNFQDLKNKEGGVYGDQLRFLDRLYKEEERETSLFLNSIQQAVSALQLKLDALSASEDAA